MKKLSALLLIFIMTMIGSCKPRESTKLLFLLGNRSTPKFEAIKVGEIIDPSKESIAVFGSGELGREEWGKIVIDWGRDQKSEFVSGGVISWAPIKSKLLKVTGNAETPLVAYLVEAKVDVQMNPLKMTVLKKWKISQGPINIKGP